LGPCPALLLLIGGGVAITELLHNAAAPNRDRPSIAVLPFANMSADPQQDYFADGMTEDLITELAKVSGPFVISRNSTFVYKGKAGEPAAVAGELGSVTCSKEACAARATSCASTFN
jgi:TolB-like protein